MSEESGIHKYKLTLDKVITPRQWKKISRELERTKSSGKIKDSLDFYLISLVWMTGLRVSEVAGLRWDDVDLDDQFLKVRDGKGSKPRTVFFGPKLAGILREFLELQKRAKNQKFESFAGPSSKRDEVSKESFLFTSNKKTPFSRVTLHRRFKKILRQADLPDSLSFHSLRHGYATRMLDQGVQLHELKTQLGHNSIATTAIYLHFTETSREKFARIC